MKVACRNYISLTVQCLEQSLAHRRNSLATFSKEKLWNYNGTNIYHFLFYDLRQVCKDL